MTGYQTKQGDSCITTWLAQTVKTLSKNSRGGRKALSLGLELATYSSMATFQEFKKIIPPMPSVWLQKWNGGAPPYLLYQSQGSERHLSATNTINIKHTLLWWTAAEQHLLILLFGIWSKGKCPRTTGWLIIIIIIIIALKNNIFANL